MRRMPAAVIGAVALLCFTVPAAGAADALGARPPGPGPVRDDDTNNGRETNGRETNGRETVGRETTGRETVEQDGVDRQDNGRFLGGGDSVLKGVLDALIGLS
ncbi:hypothetical protein ACFP1Z_27780 [Streptomyces gamaensis]|uniref:Secreted protein n=1 Tax=Streptomyces gamaensis TaxID=1763542 RepID=A0ABW0Z6B7_9ACTN